MSGTTLSVVDDLMATISGTLNIDRGECGCDQPAKRQAEQPSTRKVARNGKGKRKNKNKRNTQTESKTKLIAKDYSTTKSSIDKFTNNAEKRKWYYQQFRTYYNKLPSHLRTKYDAPQSTDTNDCNVVMDTNHADDTDYDQVLKQIACEHENSSAPFAESNHLGTLYVHNKASAAHYTEQTTSNIEETLDSSTRAQQQLLQNERKRDLVWQYLDELAGYYYTRYLHHSSLEVEQHWSYVRHEYAPLKKIYMAEYADPEALARHLAITSPDPRIPDKYWYQRYRFFSKYDEGIQMDIESWYSATPQLIADKIAQNCKCHVIVDAMCGSGGNAIAFAKECDFVIAIDIDADKLQMAKRNAEIYGVAHKIQFIAGDFFEIAARFAQCNAAMIDCVFLSPPWGGTFYAQKQFDIRYLCDDGSMNGVALFEAAQRLTPNIAYYLPKNSDYRQLRSLADKGQKCQIAKNALYNKVKAITAYYGRGYPKNKSKHWTKRKKVDKEQNE